MGDARGRAGRERGQGRAGGKERGRDGLLRIRVGKQVTIAQIPWLGALQVLVTVDASAGEAPGRGIGPATNVPVQSALIAPVVVDELVTLRFVFGYPRGVRLRVAAPFQQEPAPMQPHQVKDVCVCL